MNVDFPPVVDVKNLTRRFGRTDALTAVNLTVPPGCVFGIIGENGAGKTTLIKHLLGLLKAQQGTVRVFGRDPVADPVGVLSRIGYLSEDGDLPGWMRLDELMHYTRAFYPGWDSAYADELRRSFALEPDMVVKNLSRGQRARAGLLTALSYRPDLLLFDEPSSGLDPIVRKDILSAIVRTIADEGRTVIFSSRLLSEVERVADYVAIVDGGRIILSDSLSAITDSHYLATFRFDSPVSSPPVVRNVLSWEGSGREWTALLSGSQHNPRQLASEIAAEVVEMSTPSLEDIFIARVSGKSRRSSAGQGG